MREYHFREREQDFWRAKDGELLFETAHLSAFGVSHFAESRVGFYFKDTEEFGLYVFFAGNADDVYHSDSRTDRTFQKEETLLTNDEATEGRTHGGEREPIRTVGEVSR